MESEDDVIDRIWSKQKLNASHIVQVTELLIRKRHVSLVDPGFLSLYMTSDSPSKHVTTMKHFFRGDKQKPVVVLPINDSDHWSLLIYFARYTTFYYFDSLDEYHNDYIEKILSKFVSDSIIVDIATTKLTTITSECQSFNYECGQYVFMFIYAFLIQLDKDVQPYDREAYVYSLQSYVTESCRETHRQTFIRRIIDWILQERDS